MQVEAIREFHGVEGSVSAGQIIDVTRSRARDLHARGLVRAVAAKKSEYPSNKKAATPKNKAKA